MAHLAKYDRGAAGAMIDHYERVAEIERGYVRENIDNERTHLNYNLRGWRDPRKMVSDALERTREKTGRKVRKDANVLCDWVVTLPADVREGDDQRFFATCADFAEERYGAGNVAGAYVHMDEATPHVHIPVVPMLDGRLCAKDMLGRGDLRTFHAGLNEAVDEALGYHVSVLLDEEQTARKAMSDIGGLDAYKAARGQANHEAVRYEMNKAMADGAERRRDEAYGDLEEAEAQVADAQAAYDDLKKKVRSSRRRELRIWDESAEAAEERLSTARGLYEAAILSAEESRLREAGSRAKLEDMRRRNDERENELNDSRRRNDEREDELRRSQLEEVEASKGKPQELERLRGELIGLLPQLRRLENASALLRSSSEN